jgi:hypothetical protein
LRALQRGESACLPNGSVVGQVPKGTFYEIWEFAGSEAGSTQRPIDRPRTDKPELRLVKRRS